MYQNYNDISYAESPFGTLNQYMTKTFGWMFAGLLVTFAVAIGAISTGLVYAFINSGVFFITCIAELKPNRLNRLPTREQMIMAIKPPINLGPQPTRLRLVVAPYTAITPK